MRRIGFILLILISLSPSFAWAVEKRNLAYNLRPRQVLTYREVTTNDVLISKNPYTVRIDKQFAYMFLKGQKQKALVAMRVLSLKSASIVDGVAKPFTDSSLAQPGSELRFTINGNGRIIGKRNGEEAMILEGFPSGPVSVNQPWETLENNGTMKSQYVIKKIVPGPDHLTYYIIRGHHRARTEEERVDEAGTRIHAVTEVTGDSWTYYVAEWGQILSKVFTGDAVRCDTADRSGGPKVWVTNIKIKKELRLLKIVH
jgi:hypothetical protein